MATVAQAARDTRRLARLSGGMWRIFPYALRMRFRSTAAAPSALLRCGEVTIEARPRDWCAVEEVLLEGEYDFIRTLYPNGGAPTVIDLGANIGTFSVRCFSFWPLAVITAVEPAQDTFQVLTRNRDRNARFDWSVLRAAVWTHDGTASFTTAGHSTGSRIATDGAGSEEVPTVRLRTLLARRAREHIDLLKMDIEGAEGPVLADDPTVLANVSTLIVEVHPQQCDAESLVMLLRRCFTHISYVPGRRSTKPLLVASRQPLSLPEYKNQAAAVKRIASAGDSLLIDI